MLPVLDNCTFGEPRSGARLRKKLSIYWLPTVYDMLS